LLHGIACSPELRHHTVLTDKVAGADYDQVVGVPMSKTFDFREPF
jgi:predicted house-cleaning NTP pyrophosphatase (Maf/HAM1 superfamily)